MSRKYLLMNALLALMVSGCLGTGVETPYTKALKEAVTPTISVGTPTFLATSSSTTTDIDLTITKAGTGSVISASEIGLVTTGVGVNCSIGVSMNGLTSATVNLSNCIGDGTVRIYVKAGAIKSSTNTSNAQSTTSAAITVDNTGPSIVDVTPAEGPVGSVPPTFAVTFDEPVDRADIVSGLFQVQGNCTTPPTVGAPAFSVSDTVATVTLSGATCTAGQIARIRINQANVHDILGNAGSGNVDTNYTYTLGPTITFGAPTPTAVNQFSGDVTISMTYTSSIIPVVDNTTIQIVGTGGATCSTIAGSAETFTGANILLSGCTGTGTVRVRVLAGTIEDASGIPNTLSGLSNTFDVDNTGPTLISLTPVTGTIAGTPSEFIATFDEAVDTSTINAASFALTGTTCTIDPVVDPPAFTVSDTVVTATMSPGTCANTQEIHVALDPTTVTDVLGNPGVAGTIANILTIDSVGPTVAFDAPSSTLITSAVDIGVTITGASVTPTFDNTTVELDAVGVACTTIGGTAVTSGGGTINISGCTGDGTVRARFFADSIFDGVGNGNTVTQWSSTVTVDNTGPTVVISGLNATNATVTATFDEDVTNMTLGKFTVSGCVTDPIPGAFNAVDARTYEMTLDDSAADCAASTLTVSVDFAAVNDVVGNPGTAATPQSIP